MNTKIKKIPAVLLLVVLCLTVFPISVFAAGDAEVKIPVSVELSGEKPSPEETYTYMLEALDDAPMPQESTVTITGSGKTAFDAITYKTPGIYCYTVTQQVGKNAHGHYDETTYYVKVTVTNAEKGDLQAVVAAHTDSQMVSEKSDITFKNTYDAVKTVPNKTDNTKKTDNTVKKVKTGDSSDLNLMISLLCISGCAIGITLCKKYKKF